MRRGATKAEVLCATQEFIARNGVSAVRVDEIAQSLGISKRTLYEMFSDKRDLIVECLVRLCRDVERRIVECRCDNDNGLVRLMQLTAKMLESLYSLDRRFLSEMREMESFAELCAEHRNLWIEALMADMEMARREGLLLDDVVPRSFSVKLLDVIFELRV